MSNRKKVYSSTTSASIRSIINKDVPMTRYTQYHYYNASSMQYLNYIYKKKNKSF